MNNLTTILSDIRSIISEFFTRGKTEMSNGTVSSNTITVESDGNQNHSILINDTGTYTYIGKCEIGMSASTSVAIWQIKRVTNSTGVILWANSTNKFNQVWDNRVTTITYA